MRAAVAAALALGLGSLACPEPATAAVDNDAGVTTRLTLGSGGQQPNNHSEAPFVSADGLHVVFTSRATNLLPGGNEPGMFLADLTSGAIRRVDSPHCRPTTSTWCEPFGITAHGRFVLVWARGGPGKDWLFLHDTTNGESRLVTATPDGRRALSNIGRASVSADGHRVAFSSDSNELVLPVHDHNATSLQVYVRDMFTQTTQQVSVDVSGDHPWGGGSYLANLSGDGNVVSFESGALDLIADAPNDGRTHGYVRDLTDDQTTLVSRDSSGAPGQSGSIGGLSYDGRFVGYELLSPENGSFVLDRTTGVVRRASVHSSGAPASGYFGAPSLTESADAALFLGGQTDLVEDPEGWQDHFIHRFAPSETVLVETTASGEHPDSYHLGASIDADAGVAVFSTASSNIVANDTNGFADIFIRRYVGDAVVTMAPAEPTLPADPPPPPPDAGQWLLSNGSAAPAVDVSFRWGDGLPQVLSCNTDWDVRDGPVTFRNGSWRISTAEAPTAPSATAADVRFGTSGDLPVCGDWNGDGRDGIGVFRPSEGRWYLRNDPSSGPSDVRFVYGTSGDRPVVGDWDKDGRDEPAAFRAGTWYLANLTGATAKTMSRFAYGTSGDIPLAGDWDGDQRDGIGVRRASSRGFYLRNSPSAGASSLSPTWGVSTDLPVAGDWNSDRCDGIGLVRRQPA